MPGGTISVEVENGEKKDEQWLRERERDEGEKREDKQKNYCKWGSVSNTAGTAEAINTDLTHTLKHTLTSQIAGGFDKTVLYKHMLSHTHSHTHTISAVKSRKEEGTLS